jgi:hypothetical protein
MCLKSAIQALEKLTIIKHFTDIFHYVLWQDRLFYTAIHFHPNLTFSSVAGAYPSGKY